MENEEPAKTTARPADAPAPDGAQTASEPEVAMYCSPAQTASQPSEEPSWPMFLATARPDFWDGF